MARKKTTDAAPSDTRTEEAPAAAPSKPAAAAAPSKPAGSSAPTRRSAKGPKTHVGEHKLCPPCEGNGKTDGAICEACGGTGWGRRLVHGRPVAVV